MSEEVKSEEVLEEAEGFSEKEKAANRPAEAGTEKADSETEKADSETEKPETGTKKRDWVEEAWKCFIKDAKDIDPTDPVKAVEAYFEKNATDELKARCKAEGKDAALCWKFIEAVARKALGGRNGHIDPAVVYAIAMHWFEDVPKDWKGQAGKVAHTPRASAETPSEVKKEKAKAKKAAKPKQEQGFFFDLLETPQESEVKE